MYDFKALEIIVSDIDNASPGEIKAGVAVCRFWGNNLSVSPSKRKVWKNLATLLNNNK